MAGPWTEEESAELKRLHAQGLPLNQIHIKMGRSKDTIGRYAKKFGLSFNRAPMEAAIEANRIDVKALRQKALDNNYKITNYLQERLLSALEGGGFVALVNVGMGEQAERTLTHVPMADARNGTAAIANLLQRNEVLERLSGDGGADEAKGILVKFLATVHETSAVLQAKDV